MRRILILILCIIMVVSLPGCCLQHEWKEATCTEPITCVKCGKTEGTSLGHIWKEATCTEPITCTVCDEIDGSPLGHDWEKATYYSPKYCNRCEMTEGSRLAPQYRWNKSIGFDKYNTEIKFEFYDGDDYPYAFSITGAYNNASDLIKVVKNNINDGQLDGMLMLIKWAMETGQYLYYKGADFYTNENWEAGCNSVVGILTEGGITTISYSADKEKGITYYFKGNLGAPK